MSDINKIMEAYTSMVSEMRGATSGRRQSKVFPLNKQSEADAFAKKHGGTVKKKGATLYVTWDLPEEVDLDEASKSDPLVVVHNKRGNVETHAKLSTVAKIHGKDYSGHVDALHKGKKVSIDGGRTLSLSTQKEQVELDEAKLPSKDQINKVLGPTKNKEEGLKALMKAFGCDRATAEKCMASVMEEVEEACSRSKMKNEKQLDPVGKENDKKFKDRKDKDIDNDGDVDSSDEYLHKKRKAISKAIKKDGKSEISKIDTAMESLDLSAAFESFWSQLQEAKDSHTKGATKPEEIDSKESPKSKEFIAKHKKSDKSIEDAEEKGHDVTFKAGGKDMKQAPSRGNDNLANGDKTPVKGK